MSGVRIPSLRPLRVFISSKINTRITLLLISFLVLNLESLDSAEIFSFCLSLQELVISIIELIRGVDMISISIVVGLGCYGGIPNNRVVASRPEVIPIKEIEDKPSGFDSRTSTNCGFIRTQKPRSRNALRLLSTKSSWGTRFVFIIGIHYLLKHFDSLTKFFVLYCFNYAFMVT